MEQTIDAVSPCSWPPNWLQGKASTINPLSLYVSYLINIKWTVINIKWTVVNTKWTVINTKWTVINIKWTGINIKWTRTFLESTNIVV